MTDVDPVALEWANRLYRADIEIAELTLGRAQEDLAKAQRRVDEAFLRLKEIRDTGFAHHLETIEEARTQP